MMGGISVKGDLHCHTKLSDGSEGIEEVIAMSKRVGMDFLAITDHDTVASFSRSKILGQRYGVQVVPGVELSCIDRKRNRKVHMLCYLPEKPDRLEGHCLKICKQREAAGTEMLKKVMQYFPITMEDVKKYSSSSTSLYKQHIMHALMAYGYTTHIFSGLFKELFDSKSGRVYVSVPYPDVHEMLDLIHQAQGLAVLAKELFDSKSGRVYVSVPYPDVHEMLDLIHQAQGLAVLAHPYEYDSVDLLEELAARKEIEGVEVYHSRCKPEDEGRLIEIAQKNQLVMTGGSDFHGFYASRPSPLGNRFTPQESLNEFFRLKEQNNR